MIKRDGIRYTVYECDGCCAEMIDSLSQRNDGTYQDNFISLNGLHLCHQCGARILKNVIQNTIPRIDLTQYKGAFKHDTKRENFSLLELRANQKAFSADEFKKEYQCNFEPIQPTPPARQIPEETEPEYYLKYNSEQGNDVIDGQMYNQPYGITPSSWKEIEEFQTKMGWKKSEYDFEMDDTNYRFVFKRKQK